MARAVFGGGLSPYITKAQDRPTPYNPLGALSTAIRQPFVEDVLVPGISRIRDEMRISEQEEQIAAQAQERRDAARSAMGQAFFREAQAKMPEVPTMPSLASLSDSASVDAQQIGSMSRQLEDMVAQGMPSSALRQQVGAMDRFGLGDVAREILQGATAQESLRAAQVAKLKSQLRQQIAAPAPEAVAGPQMLQPSMRGEQPLIKNEGQYENPLQRKVDQLATRAYRNHLAGYPGDHEGALSAAQQAAQAAQPEAIAAQEVQAVERPELLEEAAAFRQQATALEAEATGIEGTPVYRNFGDHAMAFLEALETGDVAKQNALMASVGGSVDEQPFGKGAVGKAIGGDAGRSARAKLLDLKNKYLAAQRREKTGLKLIAARKPAPKAKKTGGGGGYGKKDQERLRILGNLNNDTPLSAKDRVTLKGLGLTSGEISRIKPGSAGRESWTAITRGMGKRAYSRAQNIMRGQATPEEIGDDKARADERAATVLENQARRTDNQAEKKRLEGLAADIRADAATRAREKENRAAVARLQTRLAKAEEKRDRQQTILDQGGAMNGAGVWVNVFDPNTPDAELTSEQKKKKDSVKARLASSKLAVKAITDAIDKITPATAD